MSKYNETKIFYKIYDKVSKEYVHAIVGAGTNRTQDEFGSVKGAREFNCHGMFKDKTRYEIHEFKAEISSDCIDVDPMTEQEKEELKERKQPLEEINEMWRELIIEAYKLKYKI